MPSFDPVINMDEFLEKYGTRGTTLVIEEFLRRCPDFPSGEKLAGELGVIAADLESALSNYSRRS